ncbi:MAG TPA: hypothetical protein VHB98_15120 [Chloroflexota bacterium]|nr:hypothetical protein [Chloroflexota bacterium]
MAKQVAKRGAATGGASNRKSTRKLEKARDAQQQAEQKVGKLRARLEIAESKLAKRTQRVSAMQAHLPDGAHATPRAKKPPRHQPAEHDRLAALGLATAVDGVAAPQDDAQGARNDTANILAEADGSAGSRTRRAPQTRAHTLHNEAGEDHEQSV